MVDVISTRLQEVYGAIRLPQLPGVAPAATAPTLIRTGSGGVGGGVATAATTTNADERMSANVLRRFGDEHKRRAAFNKEIEKQVSLELCNHLLLRFYLPQRLTRNVL